MRRRGRHPQGRPAAGTRRLHRLGAHAGRRGDRTPGALALRPAERRRQPRAQLPVRPGRPRAGAAGLCRATGGGELRFSTEVTACEQDDKGVTATLVDRASGSEAAGARPVRHRRRRRPEHHPQAARRADARARRMSTRASTSCFNADLRPWTAARPAALYFIEHPQMRGTFLTINGIDRWGFLVNSLAAYGYKASDFTAERSAELVRTAAGVADLDVKILGVVPWTASARVAERYRVRPHIPRRRCRARDAADRRLRHEYRRAGRAQPRLEAGVRAAGRREPSPARQLSRRAPAARPGDHPAKPEQRHFDGPAQPHRRDGGRPAGIPERTGHDLRRGLRRRPPSCPTARRRPRSPIQSRDYVPSARPGGRAPHVWLERGGERLSTIDLVGDGFVLLDDQGGPGRGARRHSASASGPSASATASLPIPRANGRLPTASTRRARCWFARMAMSAGAARR